MILPTGACDAPSQEGARRNQIVGGAATAPSTESVGSERQVMGHMTASRRTSA